LRNYFVFRLSKICSKITKLFVWIRISISGGGGVIFILLLRLFHKAASNFVFHLTLFLARKAEVVWRMTSLTIGKVVAAESPFIVMTTGAGLSLLGSQMHRSERHRYLIAS
jgi:hypothetical protein